MNKPMVRIYTVAIVMFLIGSITGFTLFSNIYTQNNNNEGTISSYDDKQFDKIRIAYELMLNDWYFGENTEQAKAELVNQAINGMLNQENDIHTTYFNTIEAGEFVSGLEGKFSGIGVSYQVIEGYPVVARVIRNSPAASSGIVIGDIFLTADGNSLENLTSEEIGNLIKGKSGTSVKLTVARGDETIELNITRKDINYSAYGEIRNNDDGAYGYLEIMQFASSTAEEVKHILEEFNNAGINRIVIDLRDNPGGYLTTVRDIAGLFLKNNSVVLKTRDRNNVIEEIKTINSNPFNFEKLVVLVNENTASASEVLAAALQEHLQVTVVGVQTYGKGTVQTQRTLYDFSIIKYTIDEWLTSLDKKLNNNGVTPDIVVEHSEIHQLYLSSLEDNTYSYDMVDEKIAQLQQMLTAFGYDTKRTDGYFSEQTRTTLQKFQTDNGIEVTGIYNEATYQKLVKNYILYVNDINNDNQYNTALEIIK